MHVGSRIERVSSVHHRWLQDHHCSDVIVIKKKKKTGNNNCVKETLALWLVDRHQSIPTDAYLTIFFHT